MAAMELWDYEAWKELATRFVKLTRDAGALAVLPVALVYLSGVHVHAGEFATAATLIEESDTITAATGNAPMRYGALFLAAWRGEEASALKLIEAATNDATARGEGRVFGLAGHATAVLNNGLGRYPAALAGARQACEHRDLGYSGWSLAELVEAGTRSGAVEEAAAALRQLEDRTRASGTNWALGILARSKALLSDGDAAESLYREAIERLEGSRILVHLARAHLVYGEWLRRENRRLDGREHLRTAYEAFSGIGTEAFAERARVELLATGETVRKRTVATPHVLTAQEQQIVRLAAERHTNAEIGSQLFISPRTVEYHLHKVFTKLGVSSRRELRAALRELEGAASPA
jgi:DNA-binding CsgD family transcriptional regulator